MKEKKTYSIGVYLNKIHYSNNLSLKDKLLKVILICLSLFYFVALSIRNFLYTIKIYKKTKLDAYVISVGNLTTGGTGKTPITAEIARYISRKTNKTVAVLSHGYKGTLSEKGINVISNRQEIFATPSEAGDEPYWLAKNLKEAYVITGRKRAITGQYAMDNFGAEVLIIDDGFQHIKLERNLDILVVDCIKKFGNNHLLPAGPLREPISEIKRADKIIVSNKKPLHEDSKSCEDYANCLKDKYGKPAYSCMFKVGKIYNIKTSEILEDKSISAVAFAAIGQPEFFFDSLKEQGINLVESLEYRDHYTYNQDDVENLINCAEKNNAKAIITTEKDAVKLYQLIEEINPKIPFYALSLAPEIDLDNLLEDVIAKLK